MIEDEAKSRWCPVVRYLAIFTTMKEKENVPGHITEAHKIPVWDKLAASPPAA